MIIFENFFGQMEKISINLCKIITGLEGKTHEYTVYPYLLNGNSLYYDNEFIKDIVFTKPNLTKVNYINYLEDDFNLEKYFLGIKQFLPFIPLFTGLFKNHKIKNINGIDKQSILEEAFQKIALNFISIISLNTKGNKKRDKDNKINYGLGEFKPINKIEEKNTISDQNDILIMSQITKYDLFIFIIILHLLN